jgi:hypothetical protein
MTSLSNYPASTSAWYAQNYYNAGCAEVESLCSECGKPCDEPTCKLCLEGIAEMIAIMDENEIEASCGLPSLKEVE